MTYAILSKSNSSGLAIDIKIIKQYLSEAGECDILIRDFNTKKSYNAKILLEHITPEMLKIKSKITYWIPNVELLTDWDMKLMKQVDFILCKTKQCYEFFKNKHPNAVYTKFTSFCNFSKASKDNNIYLHLGGTSYMKGSELLLKYWIDNNGFIDINPNIKLIMTFRHNNLSIYNKALDLWKKLKTTKRKTLCGRSVECEQYKNIYKVIHFNDADFAYFTQKAGTFIQPSVAEGYGHSINEGRCNGSNVITTNSAPMNELITNKKMLISVDKKIPIHKFIGIKYGYNSGINANFIDAVSFKKIMTNYIKLSDAKKKKMQKSNYKAYLRDTSFFKQIFSNIIYQNYVKKSGNKYLKKLKAI